MKKTVIFRQSDAPINVSGNLLEMNAEIAVLAEGMLTPDFGPSFIVDRDYREVYVDFASDLKISDPDFASIQYVNSRYSILVEREIITHKNGHRFLTDLGTGVVVLDADFGPTGDLDASEVTFGATFNNGADLVPKATIFDPTKDYYISWWDKMPLTTGVEQYNIRFDSNIVAAAYIADNLLPTVNWRKNTFKIPANTLDPATTNWVANSRIRPDNAQIDGKAVLFWGITFHQTPDVDYYPDVLSVNVGTTIKPADIITVVPPKGTAYIYETIDGVQGAPITSIPALYQMPFGNVEKVIMRKVSL